jgi:hypothetical protein
MHYCGKPNFQLEAATPPNLKPTGAGKILLKARSSSSLEPHKDEIDGNEI